VCQSSVIILQSPLSRRYQVVGRIIVCDGYSSTSRARQADVEIAQRNTMEMAKAPILET